MTPGTDGDVQHSEGRVIRQPRHFVLKKFEEWMNQEGLAFVAIDDVKKIAIPVLRHRLSTNFQAQAEGMTTEDVILRLLKEVKEPEVSKFA